MANTEQNTETASALVSKYNSLVGVAKVVGLAGYRELRVFHDKPTALARIAQLEGALAAHASGEKAEERREDTSSELQPPSNEHTDPIIDEQQENEVAKKTKVSKTKAKKTVKAPKIAAKAKKAAAPKTNGNRHSGPREGSKTEIIHGLLTRKSGCTSAEVLAATGWPAVSMPAMAKACGLELRKEKEKGSPTQYYGS